MLIVVQKPNPYVVTHEPLHVETLLLHEAVKAGIIDKDILPYKRKTYCLIKG